MSTSSSAVSSAIRELDALINTETIRARHISLIRIRTTLAGMSEAGELDEQQPDDD